MEQSKQYRLTPSRRRSLSGSFASAAGSQGLASPKFRASQNPNLRETVLRLIQPTQPRRPQSEDRHHYARRKYKDLYKRLNFSPLDNTRYPITHFFSILQIQRLRAWASRKFRTPLARPPPRPTPKSNQGVPGPYRPVAGSLFLEIPGAAI